MNGYSYRPHPVCVACGQLAGVCVCGGALNPLMPAAGYGSPVGNQTPAAVMTNKAGWCDEVTEAPLPVPEYHFDPPGHRR